jgi:hypothetical protein
MQLYASFMADHLAGVESLEVNDHLSTCDIRRVTGGLTFLAWGAEWMNGLSSEGPTEDLIGRGKAQVCYNRLKVIFGFSFNT